MTSVRRTRRVLLCALAIAVALFGLCCAKEGDPAKAALDRMVGAVHHRDAEAFMENIAADFSGTDGMTRADAFLTVKRYFAAYAILDVALSDLAIERSENAPRARFVATLGGQPQKIGGLDGLLPRSSTWKFDLRLTPDGSRWKVAWASWEPKE